MIMKTLSMTAFALLFSVNASADFTVKDAPKKSSAVRYECASKTVAIVIDRSLGEIELILSDYSLNGKLVNGSTKDSCVLVAEAGMVPSKAVLCELETPAGAVTLKLGSTWGGGKSLKNLADHSISNCESVE